MSYKTNKLNKNKRTSFSRKNPQISQGAFLSLKQGNLVDAIYDMALTGGQGNYFGKNRVNGVQGVDNSQILTQVGKFRAPKDRIDQAARLHDWELASNPGIQGTLNADINFTKRLGKNNGLVGYLAGGAVTAQHAGEELLETGLEFV